MARPEPPRTLKTKVCLVGEEAVGKSSMIRRYVLDEFSDTYITTIGTKVSKKEVTLPGPDESSVRVDMTIWDIMGQKGFRDLLKEAYFFGANGVLAVADVTNPGSLEDLDDWIDGVLNVVGSVPVVLAVNKADLRDQARLGEEDIKRFAGLYDCPFSWTSAKTGQGVEEVFRTLAQRCAKVQLRE